jgi:hypothetical protein
MSEALVLCRWHEHPHILAFHVGLYDVVMLTQYELELSQWIDRCFLRLRIMSVAIVVDIAVGKFCNIDLVIECSPATLKKRLAIALQRWNRQPKHTNVCIPVPQFFINSISNRSN